MSIEETIKKYGGELDIEKIASKHGGKVDVEKLAKRMGADIDSDYLLKKIEKIENKNPEQLKEVNEKELEERILKKIPKSNSTKVIERIVEPLEDKISPAFNKRIKAVENGMKDVFKRLSFQSTSQTTSFGGEVTKLSLLTDDVKITNPSNNQVLSYNSTNGKWENVTSSAVDDHKVLNSSLDTTANYLASKLSAGSNVTLTTQNSGGNENTQIAVTGVVTSVSGTLNRITSSGGTTPVIDISASYVGQNSITTLGTIGTGIWQGTSISTTYTDAKIKTVTGTTNRVTIGGTATDPTFDISTNYVGQATITTLGTITTGTWNASLIIGTYGGTGVNNGTKTFTYLKNISLTSADDTGVYTLPTGTKTIPSTADNLSVFASTTSLQLLGVISDETGTDSLVFANTPTLVTPILGVASATSVSFSNVAIFSEISTPSIPSANTIKLYSKDDGSGSSTAYWMSDDGIEYSLVGGGGGVTVFTGLTDVPNSYSGQALKIVQVNSGETGLQFATTVPVAQGGTNIASYTAGDLLYASSSIVLSKLAIGSSNKFLTVSAGLPLWGDAVDLTTNQTISSGTKTFIVLPQSSATPSSSNDLTTKTYVDTLLSTGARFVDAVNTTTITTLAANTYANGTLGVGATLTGNANGAFATIDGVAAVLNNLYLVKNETTGANNGMYKLTTVGDGSNPYVLTRATNYDVSAEIVGGTFFNVLAGTTNASTQWALINTGTTTVGTTALTFAQLSSPIVYTASLGVQKVGNDFRADFVLNDGLKLSTNSLTVAYDNSSIGITSNLLTVKALGITNAMLAGSIADSKLSQITTASKVSGAAITSLSSVPSGAGVLPTANLGSGSPDSTTFLRGDQTWAVPAGSGAGTASLSYTKSQDTSATSVTVSNTVTETTIYSYSVPANTLGTNKVLRFTVNGTYTNQTGVNRTITVRVKYGATTILTKTSGSIGSAVGTGSFNIEGNISEQAGSTSTQGGYMYCSFESGNGTSVDWTDRGNINEDSTAIKTLSVTVQHSVASASLSLTKKYATLELLNASDTIGAPTDASYVTLATNGNLSNERVLTGTANQIVITDNGAGSTVVLSIPSGATLTSPILTTPNIGAATGTSLALSGAIGRIGGATGVSLSAVTGVLTIVGIGNTNNENLTLDFESVANAVTISTGTGVTDLIIPTILKFTIGNTSYIGRLGEQISLNEGGTTNSERSGMAINQYNTSAAASVLIDLSRSKSSTVGTHTILVDNDVIAVINAQGSTDSVNGFSGGAGIVFRVDGTPTAVANGMPGEVALRTSPGGGVAVIERMNILSSGNVGIGQVIPTAVLHIKAGTATASTAPLKFTSGTLLTTAEAGAVEFLTDAFYGTITTGAARKTFAFLESPVFTGTITLPTVTQTGLTTTYNNIATVSNGVPSEVAKVDTTGLTANVGATTIYAVPASGAGMYRVSSLVVETTAGSLSSTLPNVQIVYTDNETGGVITIDATPILGIAGIGQTGALNANTVGTTSTGVIVINAKASTNIQYQTVNYASNLAGMAYALHVKLEAM